MTAVKAFTGSELPMTQAQVLCDTYIVWWSWKRDELSHTESHMRSTQTHQAHATNHSRRKNWSSTWVD